MGIIQNLFDRLNTRKYNKLKKEYIEKFRKTGCLGDISNIQEYISKKNIKVISKTEKYGDNYDIVEEIFGDVSEIIEKIKKFFLPINLQKKSTDGITTPEAIK